MNSKQTPRALRAAPALVLLGAIPAMAAPSAGVTAALEDVTAIGTAVTGMGTTAGLVSVAVVGAGLLGLGYKLFRRHTGSNG